MTALPITSANDDKPLPDLAKLTEKLDRKRYQREHELAADALSAAHDLVYAAGYRFADRDDVTDEMRSEWLHKAAEFALSASGTLTMAGYLLNPPPSPFGG